MIDLPFVDRDRVAVYDVSGGAATASVVATRFGGIRALILVAGVYDVGELYPTGEPGMDRQIEQSAGTSPEAFAARAALRSAERITASTLLLPGALDRDVTREQARRLAARLRSAGVPVRERIYEGVGHQIPIPAQWEEIDPFLREVIGR